MAFLFNDKKNKLNKINNLILNKKNNVWKNTYILTNNNKMEKIKVNKQFRRIKNINNDNNCIG